MWFRSPSSSFLERVEHHEGQTDARRDLRGGHASSENAKPIKGALAIPARMHSSRHRDYRGYTKQPKQAERRNC